MTIFNLGSINADYFYDVPHIPAPGETLASTGHHVGLGGKGANQSVAVAKAGARAVHIGAVGADGHWAIDRLTTLDVETDFIRESEQPTAHAIITVASDGENAIVLFPGANHDQSPAVIETALSGGGIGDTLILQNETSHQVEAAAFARDAGLRVVYSAAPFSIEAVQGILPCIDMLVVNEVEAAQLTQALGRSLHDIAVPEILVTKGSKGAAHHDLKGGEITQCAAYPVTPIDTTGAGDTFLGYFVAGRDQWLGVPDALQLASAAAALKVTKPGTADAIPSLEQVKKFLDRLA